MINILQELEARLHSVGQKRNELHEDQKNHSRKASDIQKSLIKLDGEEKMIKELFTFVKSKKQ